MSAGAHQAAAKATRPRPGAPLSSRVLAELRRGPTSRLIVSLDEWPDGTRTVKVAAHRPRPRTGEEYVRRSVTLYADELRPVAVALAGAWKILGGAA